MTTLTTSGNNQKIVSDIKVVVADVEEILKATAETGSEKAAELRQSIGKKLSSAKLRLADAESTLREKAEAATCNAAQCVRKNPWQSVGIAAAVGVLVGILLVRS